MEYINLVIFSKWKIGECSRIDGRVHFWQILSIEKRYPKENNIKALKITFYSSPTIGPHRPHGINAYKATVLHIHPLQILKIKYKIK